MPSKELKMPDEVQKDFNQVLGQLFTFVAIAL